MGFPNVIPACAGRIVEKEVRELDEILSVAKAPHVVVLGGSKVADRLEAISLLIKNGQADHILLTGVIASVFLRAQARIKYHLEITDEEELVRKAHALIGEYPDVFSTPVDIAIERNGKRVEIMVRELVAKVRLHPRYGSGWNCKTLRVNNQSHRRTVRFQRILQGHL